MFGVFAIDEILRYRGTWFPGSRTLCHPALDEMPNNGVVLVVTSAGSHQLELEKSIKEKSSKKNVKIYFTFSPFCREACGDSLPVYKRLSDNRMFNLSDFSSKSFLETVVYTV